MITKSFGQFLHERGLLDGGQLLEVLDQVKTAGATAESVAVAERPGQNSCNRALMSRLLIENGIAERNELALAELEYAERSLGGSLQLKLTMEQAPHSRMAEIGAGVIQQLYERVMGSPLELGISGTDVPSTVGSRVWSQTVHVGGEAYTLALLMNDADALSLATVVLGIQLDEFDDLAEDAVSEFLNLVIGHICGNLSTPGGVKADPPRVTTVEESDLGSSEAVVLECDGDDVVFHFALP